MSKDLKELITSLFWGLEITQKQRDINIKINDEFLEKYIDFCFDKNLSIKTKDTNSHHIMPKSLFGSIDDLSQYPWNKIELTKEDHIIAHWLLFLAIPSKETKKMFTTTKNTLYLDSLNDSNISDLIINSTLEILE